MARKPEFNEIPFRPAAPGEGYFEDDSLIRRVNRELIVAFSGARALLMQAAHPVMFEGFFLKTAARDSAHERLARTATVMN
ncbi:MAG: oxygenase MpaB family protein, partial [Solirubrobacterales bacterium]